VRKFRRIRTKQVWRRGNQGQTLLELRFRHDGKILQILHDNLIREPLFLKLGIFPQFRQLLQIKYRFPRLRLKKRCQICIIPACLISKVEISCIITFDFVYIKTLLFFNLMLQVILFISNDFVDLLIVLANLLLPLLRLENFILD
jgi:hypothetical protein